MPGRGQTRCTANSDKIFQRGTSDIGPGPYGAVRHAGTPANSPVARHNPGSREGTGDAEPGHPDLRKREFSQVRGMPALTWGFRTFRRSQGPAPPAHFTTP